MCLLTADELVSGNLRIQYRANKVDARCSHIKPVLPCTELLGQNGPQKNAKMASSRERKARYGLMVADVFFKKMNSDDGSTRATSEGK